MSELPANLKSIESALAGLVPDAALNRDRLMFEAGRRSAKNRAWPVATGILALSTAMLSIWTMARPIAPHIVEIAKADAVQLPMTIVQEGKPNWGHALQSSGYLSLRDRVLFFGVDALPPAPPAGASNGVDQNDPPSMRRLLRSL